MKFKKFMGTIAFVAFVVLLVVFIKTFLFNGDHYGNAYKEQIKILDKRKEVVLVTRNHRPVEKKYYYITVERANGRKMECTSNETVYNWATVGATYEATLRDYINKDGIVLEVDINSINN